MKQFNAVSVNCSKGTAVVIHNFVSLGSRRSTWTRGVCRSLSLFLSLGSFCCLSCFQLFCLDFRKLLVKGFRCQIIQSKEVRLFLAHGLCKCQTFFTRQFSSFFLKSSHQFRQSNSHDFFTAQNSHSSFLALCRSCSSPQLICFSTKLRLRQISHHEPKLPNYLQAILKFYAFEDELCKLIQNWLCHKAKKK